MDSFRRIFLLAVGVAFIAALPSAAFAQDAKPDVSAAAPHTAPQAAPEAPPPDGGGILTRDAVLRDAEIPVLGNPDGDITIVEYFDYQCPYCKKVAPLLAKVVKQDGKVRWVLKDWPVFGPVSSYAARMVLAAKYQDKYQAAHEALMGAKTKLTEDKVRDVLAKAGVDVARAAADLETNRKTLDSLMSRNTTQALAFGFLGTPSFIIGTFRVPGVLEEAGFRAAIADARKAAAQK